MYLIVSTPGYSVHCQSGRLVIRHHDADLCDYPLQQVETLICFAGVHVSEAVIFNLSRRGVQILFLSSTGRLKCILQPVQTTGAVFARMGQYRTYFQKGLRLFLARQFVKAKLHNMKRFLNERSVELPPLFNSHLNHINAVKSIDELRGVEGNCARIYFGKLRSFCPPQFRIDQRVKRQAPDLFNQALSFCYSLLYHATIANIYAVQLDPYLGFYHQPRYSHAALASDIMEAYRAQIVDRIVVKAFNTKEFVERLNTEPTENGQLSKVAIGYLRQQFAERLHTQRKIGDENMDFFALINRDAQRIRAFCQGELGEFRLWMSD